MYEFIKIYISMTNLYTHVQCFYCFVDIHKDYLNNGTIHMCKVKLACKYLKDCSLKDFIWGPVP